MKNEKDANTLRANSKRTFDVSAISNSIFPTLASHPPLALGSFDRMSLPS